MTIGLQTGIIAAVVALFTTGLIGYLSNLDVSGLESADAFKDRAALLVQLQKGIQKLNTEIDIIS